MLCEFQYPLMSEQLIEASAGFDETCDHVSWDPSSQLPYDLLSFFPLLSPQSFMYRYFTPQSKLLNRSPRLSILVVNETDDPIRLAKDLGAILVDCTRWEEYAIVQRHYKLGYGKRIEARSPGWRSEDIDGDPTSPATSIRSRVLRIMIELCATFGF